MTQLKRAHIDKLGRKPPNRKCYDGVSIQCVLLGDPLRWLLNNNEAVRTGKPQKPLKTPRKRKLKETNPLVLLEKSNEELRRKEAYKLKYG